MICFEESICNFIYQLIFLNHLEISWSSVCNLSKSKTNRYIISCLGTLSVKCTFSWSNCWWCFCCHYISKVWVNFMNLYKNKCLNAVIALFHITIFELFFLSVMWKTYTAKGKYYKECCPNRFSCILWRLFNKENQTWIHLKSLDCS